MFQVDRTDRDSGLLLYLSTKIAFKKLETARTAYDFQFVEFKTSCVNNRYICSLLLKYVRNALRLILGQKLTLTLIINTISEFTSCLNSGGHVLVY